MDDPLNPQVLARVRQLRALARLFDSAMVIPGTRIRLGIDSLLGLIPVAGDLVTACVSAYIIREAAKLGVPNDVLMRMVLNVVVDVAGGAVPLAGDFFDVFWKANNKNIDLLEKHLRIELERFKENSIPV